MNYVLGVIKPAIYLLINTNIYNLREIDNMPHPIAPNQQVPTVEQIAKQYSAAMDSVNLINQIAAQTTITQDDVNTVNRNIAHLKIMLTKSFWTTEDLAPLRAAAALVVVVK